LANEWQAVKNLPSMTTPQDTQQIYSTVPKKDYFKILSGNPQYDELVDRLGFSKAELARTYHVPLASVRYEPNRIPAKLRERLEEMATVFGLVADHFDSDLSKAGLWFRTKNPLLGDMSPRDMLRFGRYGKLMKFILAAHAGY
jgi:hypothetical protein